LRFSSKSVVLVGVFAAVHTILYLISPPALWRSWSIYLEPLEGIVLGPWVGFCAALIGSIIARSIRPTDLWMFGIIAEPTGVLASGLIAKRKWKPLLALYAIMLGAYFIHPFGRWLPIWTILDVLAALILIYPVASIGMSPFKEDTRRLSFSVALIAFIGTVTDALVRVFLLIPVGLYMLFLWSPEVVYSIFISSAIYSYIEDFLVVLVSSLVSPPLLAALRKVPGIKFPLS
jgi:hypothetical protein